jgi:hypothetical protein
MNLPLTLGAILLAIVCLAIAIEVGRLRSTKHRRLQVATAPPRRSEHLEKRMLSAFAGPRKEYGDCFAEFSVWRQSDNTRMDVKTKGNWLGLNVFTRSLIVRHLWQTLQGFVKGTVLVRVDFGAPGAILWNAAQAEHFDDKGVVAPWLPAKGRAGTLISGR